MVSIVLGSYRSVGHWVLEHWVFTYEYEFIKRALVGETIRQLQVDASEATLSRIANSVSVASVAVLALFFYTRVVVSGREAGEWLFLFLATTHFATLQHFLFDAGRFDHLGVLLLLASILGTERLPPGPSLLAVVSLSGIGILVHEAFYFMFVPMSLAYWLYHNREVAGSFPSALISGVVLSLATWLVARHGGVDSMTWAEYVAARQSTYGWTRGAVEVLFQRTDTHNSLVQLLSWKTVVDHVLFAAVLLPTVVLVFRLLRRYRATQSGVTYVDTTLFVAALCPLLLYVFGYDFGRWWAAAITNLFIMLALLFRSANLRSALHSTLADNRMLVVATVALSLVVGPVGDRRLLLTTENIGRVQRVASRVLCPLIGETPKERRIAPFLPCARVVISSQVPNTAPARYSLRTTRGAARSPGLHSTAQHSLCSHA